MRPRAVARRKGRRTKQNYLWKRTPNSSKAKQNPHEQARKRGNLEMLEWAAGVGEICLKYLDDNGFNLWANVTYSWSKRGEQKRIEQTKKKGKRLNICGLLEIGKGFEYGLALKSFKSDSYIKLMDWQAEKTEKRFSEKGQITVIVEDQGAIHVSRATKAQYKKWESQGLYIFLLPTYSPELNWASYARRNHNFLEII